MAVVGFALIALTPAAPSALRRVDALFVHVYRVFDFVIVRLREAVHPDLERTTQLPAAVSESVRRGVSQWDVRLHAGLKESAPELETVVARVVALDRAKRRLLIDAGRSVTLEAGDPVTAGSALVGRVASAKNGVAVVDTPWTKEARFAGASVGEGELGPVRFVIRGLDREDVVAAVTNPERREGLRSGVEVVTPELSDLLPDSVRRAPVGLLLGRLALDEFLERASGEVAYLVRPIVDVELLDAVIVGVPAERVDRAGEGSFQKTPLTKLSCSLLATWRDGAVASGSAAIGGAVMADGYFVGVVDDARFGTVRIRGIFDPGNELHVLVLAENDTYPAQLRSLGKNGASTRAKITRITSGREIGPGDRLVSAGRGPHIARGLLIGEVLAAEGEELVIRAPRPTPGRSVFALVRTDYPADPWGG